MKKTCLIFLLFTASFITAQDTTKLMRHEIGFNSVSLIKQLVSNNPGTVLAQLPYTVFYNFNINKLLATRLGFGGGSSSTSFKDEELVFPRNTKSSNLNLRLGFAYNFVQQKRVTINGFLDAIYSNAKYSTISTNTIQSFPNPVSVETTESKTESAGSGIQIGAGVKFNIYKHLSLYAELPISYLTTTTKSTDKIESSGKPPEEHSTSTTNVDTRITIPTTLYLILSF